MTATQTVSSLTIDHLGARGDGVAEAADGPAYIPFTLPGERVHVRREGKRWALEAIERPSPQRGEPPCPHFTTCGGCDLQHADAAIYTGFKRDKVVTALARAGVDATVDALVPCTERSRRRLVLTAAREDTGVALGLNAAGSNQVVAIETCPIARPEIEDALPALRTLATRLVDRRKPLRLTVTLTDSGLDIAAGGAGRVRESERQAAIRDAVAAGFARLSVDGEVWVMTRTPMLTAGDIPVELPVGGFVQPVEAAEAAMAERVVAHLKGCKQVGDLYAGFGAFSLRLARHARVQAMEVDGAAMASLDRAMRGAKGLKPVRTERRDLDRRPPIPREMLGWDGVVFDPPRAGAETVSRSLAASKVRKIAAVSCNPATLARDLAILLEGGYRIDSITPIDQFLWSHHTEAVALLSRR